MRYRDPRRFGCWLWTDADPARHRLLARLGPEPLGPGFDGDWLHARLRGRRAPIKNLLMDSRIVAGVGNIYASEALFIAGVDPRRAGGRVARRRIDRVVCAVREVLSVAVEAGGTTLRDYARTDGAAGGVRRSAQRVRGATASPVRAAPRRSQGPFSGSARPGSAGDASGDGGQRPHAAGLAGKDAGTFAKSSSRVSSKSGSFGMQSTGHDHHALGLVVMADALGAPRRVDDVDLLAHRDRLVRALGLADVAVDALVGDQQRHADSVPLPPGLRRSAASTAGCTKPPTSPPRAAISRTRLEEMKV